MVEEPGMEPRRGEDIESTMEIDFLDAVRGFQTSITLQRPVTCETCQWLRELSRAAIRPSVRSAAAAAVNRWPRGRFNFAKLARVVWERGKLPGDPCTVCRGAGRVLRAETIRVNIPPGAEPSKRIRLRGKGEAGVRGGPRRRSLYCAANSAASIAHAIRQGFVYGTADHHW